jgi:hypothetical protein
MAGIFRYITGDDRTVMKEAIHRKEALFKWNGLGCIYKRELGDTIGFSLFQSAGLDEALDIELLGSACPRMLHD